MLPCYKKAGSSVLWEPDSAPLLSGALPHYRSGLSPPHAGGARDLAGHVCLLEYRIGSDLDLLRDLDRVVDPDAE
jgi:hypothetical protein